MALDGKEVGRVLVKVSPDTSKFRRELEAKLKSMDPEVQVEANFDDNDLSEKVDEAAARSGSNVKVGIDLDKAKLRPEVTEAVKEAGVGENVHVGIDLDKTRIKALSDLGRVVHAFPDLQNKIDKITVPGADSSELDRAAKSYTHLAGIRSRYTKGAVAEAERIAKANAKAFNQKLSSKSFRESVAALKKEWGSLENVPDDIFKIWNRKALNWGGRIQRSYSSQFREGLLGIELDAEKIAGALGRNFGNSMRLPILMLGKLVAAGAAATAALGPLAGLAYPAAAAFISLGDALAKASGSLLLAPAAISAAGVSLNILKTSFKGFAGLIAQEQVGSKAWNTALEKIPSTARPAAAAMAAFAIESRKAVAQSFWTSFVKNVKGSFAEVAKITKTGMNDVASSWGRAFAQVADVFAEKRSSADIKNFFTNTKKAVDNLVPGLRSFVRIWLDLTSVGSGFLPGMAKDFSDWAKSLQQTIRAEKDSGKLKQKIEDGLAAVESLFRSIGNIWRGVSNIMETAQRATGVTGKSFEDVTKGFENWTASVKGQYKLTKVFKAWQDAGEAMRPVWFAVGNVFVDVVDDIARFAKILSPVLVKAVGDFGSGFESISPQLGKSLQTIGNALEPLIKPLIKALGPAVEAFAIGLNSISPTAKIVIETIGKVLQKIVDIANAMGPTGQKIFAVVTTAAVLGLKLVGLGTKLFALVDVIKFLRTGGKLSALSTANSGIRGMANNIPKATEGLTAIGTEADKAGKKVGNGKSGLAGRLRGLTDVFGGGKGRKGFAADGITAIGDESEKAGGKVGKAAKSSGKFRTGLGKINDTVKGNAGSIILFSLLSGAIDDVTDSLSKQANKPTKTIKQYSSFGKFVSQATDALSAVPDALGQAWGWLTGDSGMEKRNESLMDKLDKKWKEIDPGAPIRKWFEEQWSQIEGMATSVADFFTGIWNSIGDFWSGVDKTVIGAFSDAGTWLGNVGSMLWNGFINGVTAAWSGVSSFFATIGTSIGQAFASAGSWLFSAGSSVVSGLWNGIKSAWSGVSSFFGSVGTTIGHAFATAGRWLSSAGSSVIRGLWSGIKSAWAGVSSFFGSVGTTIGHFFANAGRWLWSKGTSLISGLWSGIKSAWTSVSSFFGRIGSTIGHFFAGAGRWLWSKGISVISGLWGGLKSAWGTVARWISGIPSAIGSFFSGAGRWLVNAGRNVITGFWNGLVSVWNRVKGWVGGIGSWIQRNKGPVTYDRRLLIPAGKAIMAGFDEGLRTGFGDVQARIQAIPNQLSSALTGAQTTRSGVAFMDNLATGIKSRAPHVERAMNKSLAGVSSSASAAWDASIGSDEFGVDALANAVEGMTVKVDSKVLGKVVRQDNALHARRQH